MGSLGEVRQTPGIENYGVPAPPNYMFPMNEVSPLAEVLHPEPRWWQTPSVLLSVRWKADTTHLDKVRSTAASRASPFLHLQTGDNETSGLLNCFEILECKDPQTSVKQLLWSVCVCVCVCAQNIE